MELNNKKGDVTFTQISVAIIAIVVLLILIMIFSGKMGGITRDVESCQANGGRCFDGECPEGGFERIGDYSECRDSQKCCIIVFESDQGD